MFDLSPRRTRSVFHIAAVLASALAAVMAPATARADVIRYDPGVWLDRYWDENATTLPGGDHYNDPVFQNFSPTVYMAWAPWDDPSTVPVTPVWAAPAPGSSVEAVLDAGRATDSILHYRNSAYSAQHLEYSIASLRLDALGAGDLTFRFGDIPHPSGGDPYALDIIGPLTIGHATMSIEGGLVRVIPPAAATSIHVGLRPGISDDAVAESAAGALSLSGDGALVTGSGVRILRNSTLSVAGDSLLLAGSLSLESAPGVISNGGQVVTTQNVNLVASSHSPGEASLLVVGDTGSLDVGGNLVVRSDSTVIAANSADVSTGGTQIGGLVSGQSQRGTMVVQDIASHEVAGGLVVNDGDYKVEEFGTLSAGSVSVGDAASGTGAITLEEHASATIAGALTVGEAGKLTVQAGSAVAPTVSLEAGSALVKGEADLRAGATTIQGDARVWSADGDANLTLASGASLGVGGDISVENGSLYTGGAATVAGSVLVGRSGDEGALIVTGGTLGTGADLTIGESGGQGTAVFAGGVTTVGGDLALGKGNDVQEPEGTILVDGGVVSVVGATRVGQGGRGEVEVRSGVLAAGDLTIGLPGGSGSVAVTGQSAHLGARDVLVGGGGTGILAVANGEVDATGTLAVAQGGIYLQSGGDVATARTEVQAGGLAGQTGGAHFAGGVGVAGGGLYSYQGGSLAVGATGLANAGEIRVGAAPTALGVAGTFTNGASGLLDIDGADIDVTAREFVNAGLVQVRGDAMAAFVPAQGQYFSNTGEVVVTEVSRARIDGYYGLAGGLALAEEGSLLSLRNGALTGGEVRLRDSTLSAQDVFFTGASFLDANAGSIVYASSELALLSENAARWDTLKATLAGTSFSADAPLTLWLGAEDLGAVEAGFAGNFAWGTLDLLDSAATVFNSTYADAALYTRSLLIDIADLGRYESVVQGLTVYYDPGAAGNAYLSGLTYQFSGGAFVPIGPGDPVPEPATFALAAGGLVAALLRGRRS